MHATGLNCLCFNYLPALINAPYNIFTKVQLGLEIFRNYAVIIYRCILSIDRCLQV